MRGEVHMERIPVILDTDIGGDIDDTWALAMINLRSRRARPWRRC